MMTNIVVKNTTHAKGHFSMFCMDDNDIRVGGIRTPFLFLISYAVVLDPGPVWWRQNDELSNN